MIKKIINILLYIWQLPQHLLALILWLLYCRKKPVATYKHCKIYKIAVKYFSGVSLGNYIILDEIYFSQRHYDFTIKHEYGHSRQSRMLGIFYLIAVGIPSIFNNLMARVSDYYYNNYYLLYPEKWANKLGNVTSENDKNINL